MLDGYQSAYQLISFFAVLLLMAPGAILSLLVCVKVFESARYVIKDVLAVMVERH